MLRHHPHGNVLYHDSSKLKVGGVMRYTITGNDLTKPLFCRVRNTELSAMRAAYLNGPYSLYVDMRPEDYNEFTKAEKGAEPVYDYHLKSGQHFSFQLPVLHRRQTWIVTVQSEILFSRSADINFELTIGDTEGAAKYHGANAKKHFKYDASVEVIKQDTSAIWQSPFPKPEEPLHVCVLTHGLVSNVTADMLYMKEVIDNAAALTGENLVCKGYTGNVCRTGRGIKYLGQRLAYWIMDELIPTYKPKMLSFLAHSLGGPTQTYALGFIQATNPGILDGIELVNFISFASPFLGISAENPGYVQFALDFGIVGKSGRDLGLSWTPGTEKPLLERLPNHHTLDILRKFKNRTIYANAVHDGIVPLRTSALVFLDWYAIAGANKAYKSGRKNLIRYQQSHNGKTSMQSALEARVEVEEEQQRRAEEEEKQQRERLEKQRRNSTSSSSTLHFTSRPLFSTENSESVDEVSDLTESESSSTDGSSSERQSTTDKEPGSMSRPDPKPLQERHSTDEENTAESLSSFLFERNQAKVFSRYQTVNDEKAAKSVGKTLPHKTSLIENGIFILLPPHPNNNFITDPESRENVILHDRVYSEKDLPPKKYKKSIIGNLSGHKDGKIEIAKREEKIARRYHHKLTWRKVIVSLLPEAHNNIVVRRRFSNAYGWPVVHHCVNEHFLNYKKDESPEEQREEIDNKSKQDTDFNRRIISDQSYDLSDPIEAMRLYDDSSSPSSPKSPDSPSTMQSTASSIAHVNPPWSESEDDIETGPDIDHDPQRASMLKVIRN